MDVTNAMVAPPVVDDALTDVTVTVLVAADIHSLLLVTNVPKS